jgi:hypothetical protein
MNPLPSRSLPLGALAALISLAAVSASAATIPYTNDFSSGTLPANNNLFTAGGGFLNYSGAVGSTSGTPVAFSSVQLSNSANTSYTVSSTFRFSALDTSPNALLNTGDQTVGLVAFSTTDNFSSRLLIADWTVLSTTSGNIGRLRLIDTNLGGAVTNLTLGNADPNGLGAGAADLNVFYTLRLTITTTATPNSYSVSLGLFNSSGDQVGTSASATYLAATAPTNGYFSGVRARLPVPSQASGPTTVQVDSFSVIPEPSAFAMLAGLGALGFAASRRRRA